ncbi:MAG: hypothetical protein WA749_14075 [Gelidibacter sp.]
MAEIKIEKKKPLWVWVFLALVVLIIVGYIIYVYQGETTPNGDLRNNITREKVNESPSAPMTTNDPNKTSNAYGGTYDNFMAFDESIRDSTRISVDSSYTKKAYSNLTKLVVKQADKNTIADSKALDDLRNHSVLITNIATTSSNMENLKNVKMLSDKIASVIGDIQAKSYPALQQEASDLKQLASKISVSTPMNKQQADINAFLRKSRDILKSMN